MGEINKWPQDMVEINILPPQEVEINIEISMNKIKAFNLSCEINKNGQAKTPGLPPPQDI